MHTQPGQANGLAYFFDQHYVHYGKGEAKGSGIIGTIAGDDTVLLVLKSKADMKEALSLILPKNRS